MTTQTLTPEERTYLLTLARASIEEATGKPSPPPELSEDAPRLTAPGAAFVTLHTWHGDLRGCIGSLVAHRPLIDDVRENAVAAALRDPRFPPVTAKDLPGLVIEVSVLSAPEPLAFDSPDDLLRTLRPNIDGVVIAHGWNRATFLPQVWEQLPSPEAFLSNLCYKAGLPGNAWRWPDLEVSIYQVEEFEEKR